jgi:hypothetical protein
MQVDSDGLSPTSKSKNSTNHSNNNNVDYSQQMLKFRSPVFLITFMACFSIGFIVAGSFKFLYFRRSHPTQISTVIMDDYSIESFKTQNHMDQSITSMNKLTSQFFKIDYQRETFHFVFGIDCNGMFKQNWVEWTSLSSFLNIYPAPGQGGTFTILINCDNGSYIPPWYLFLFLYIYFLSSFIFFFL